MRSIAFMLKKEFKQIFRTREMIAVIFVVPLVQMLVLGFAITNEVKHIKLVIADRDQSSLSRELADLFSHTDRFDIVGHVSDYAEIDRLIHGWTAQMALVIPPHFQRDLMRNLQPDVQIVVDGLDGNTAGVALGYARGILVEFGLHYATHPRPGRAFALPAAELSNPFPATMPFPEVERSLSPAISYGSSGREEITGATAEGGNTGPIERPLPGTVAGSGTEINTNAFSGRPAPRPGLVTMAERMWYNLNLNSAQYMVPGIVVVLLTIITMMLSSVNLVREREIGTLEQLMVTPLKKYQLLLGKILPFLILAFVELAIVLQAAQYIFHIHMAGSYLLLYGLASLYLFATLGLGIFISTITSSQQQAFFVSWFFMVFMIMMSGLFIPIENMPYLLQQSTYLNPTRYFMYIMRDIFQKGATLPFLLPEVVPMAFFGVAIFAFSVQRFQKRVR